MLKEKTISGWIEENTSPFLAQILTVNGGAICQESKSTLKMINLPMKEKFNNFLA